MRVWRMALACAAGAAMAACGGGETGDAAAPEAVAIATSEAAGQSLEQDMPEAPGAAAARQEPSAAPRGLPDGAVRVKRAEIIDRNGFEKPMTAMTVLIPADWNSEGAIVWGVNNPCSAGSGYGVRFQAASQDGLSGVEILPTMTWVWNNFSYGDPSGACPFMRITGVQDYLGYFVSQARQGARTVEFRPRPDIAKSYEMLNSVTPMPGGEMRSWVDAGEVLISYSANGVEMRETLAAAVVLNRTYMQGSMGMADSEIITGSVMPGFSMRAPADRFNAELGEMIRKSGRAMPEWSARIAQHNAKISQMNIQGARERSQIIAQTGEEIRQMQQDSWRRQNDSFDRMSRESSEAIRGVETYNDPYHGGTVELDHTYDNAWQLNDGTYVLTDDAMFEPFRDLGIEGQKLQAVE